MDEITLVYGGESALTLTSINGQTLTLEQTEETFILDGGLAGPRGVAGQNGTGDKTFFQLFSNTNTVNVTHNLGKYPAVTVIDSAQDEVEGDVYYIDSNNLTINFSAPFSGAVTLN